MTIKGKVKKVIYHNPENNYYVFKFVAEDEQETITVNGIFLDIHPGLTLELQGNIIFNKYGEQFKAEGYKVFQPSQADDIEKYLAGGLIKGIGPAFAKRIVETFKEDSLFIIENEPEKLFLIPGIGEKKVQVIIDSYEKQKNIKDIMMYLSSFNISIAYAMKIYKFYGAKSKKILAGNPYQLAEDIVGIGFFVADKIAMELGFEEDSIKRGKACITYVLKEKSKLGHVFLKRTELYDFVKQMISFDNIQIESAIEGLFRENKIVIETIKGEEVIYLKYLYECEKGVIEDLGRLISYKEKNKVEVVKKELKNKSKDEMSYNEKQKLAIEYSLNKKVLIITGGPGTGKTTTTRGIIRALIAGGHQVVLAAPTGRAAKRLSQVVEYEAKTIHRLLEYNKEGSFLKNKDNPLEGTAFIVDESSMIDLTLFYSLLKSIPSKASLILIGDIDQLPAIGPGNILKDLITSEKIPTIYLTEIYRQGENSKIITNAHLINKKKMPVVENSKDDDFFLIKEAKDEKILEILVDLCKNRLPKSYDFNPITDIQILVPMKKGIIGSKNINKVLQQVFNPSGKSIEIGENIFRVRDKVIQTKNNYEKNIFNGDIGYIEDIKEDEILVDFDGESVSYDISEIDELQLGYCLTIHKSQGSEYKAVIIPISNQHYVMLGKNLLYTGVTRAKSLFILISSDKALKIAVNKENVNNRNTGLSYFFKMYFES